MTFASSCSRSMGFGLPDCSSSSQKSTIASDIEPNAAKDASSGRHLGEFQTCHKNE